MRRVAIAMAFCTQAATALEVSTPVVVSIDPSGAPSQYCRDPKLSDSARYLTFWCQDAMTADDEPGVDTFTRDLHSAVIDRVSVGEPSNVPIFADRGSTGIPSNDGELTIFASPFPLHPDAGPISESRRPNIFLRDIPAGTTSLISRTADGYGGPKIFGADLLDVNYARTEVLFVGYGNYDGGPPETSYAPEIFVRNWVTGAVERISVQPDGQPSNGTYAYPPVATMSADGRYVAFTSNATNLTNDNPRAFVQVFVRDRQARTTERVTRTWHGKDESSESYYFDVDMTADGRYLVVCSNGASELVPGQRYGGNVFVIDRISGTTTEVSVVPALRPGYWYDYSSAEISDDGRFVAMAGRPMTAVADVPASPGSLVVRDRLTGESVDVSSTLRHSLIPFRAYVDLSPDGRMLVFDWQSDGIGTPGIRATTSVYSVDILGGPLPRIAEIPALSRLSLGLIALSLTTIGAAWLRRISNVGRAH